MVPNPSPFLAPLRSIRPVPAPPPLGPGRCRRSWSHPSADDRSRPRVGLSRTSSPAPAFAPVSSPRVGGGSRASGNATSSVRPCSKCVCRLGSFFSQRVGDLAQFLGHVKAIDHRLAVGQKVAARLQVRGSHVRMVGAHRLALLGRQSLPTPLARRLVPSL